ncbi:PREDICTED: deoxyribonuclease-1-like 2 isoform X1 [Chinchilla lanigera]|uniref:deoxyribonuclease-1-like 2 isoform X1 n=1 Tax=Chinchilla lanigera TaxID=34839 RepID=UPI0006973305|nr:PREDICTED: deoxyribonuclease-1-like 2 isoform X1 [Chinchilla lanigera]
MGGPGALLVAVWVLGFAGSVALRIGAFNIQSFGDRKASDPACGSVIAQLFDLTTPPPDPGWLRHHACAGGAGPRPERCHNTLGADQQRVQARVQLCEQQAAGSGPIQGDVPVHIQVTREGLQGGACRAQVAGSVDHQYFAPRKDAVSVMETYQYPDPEDAFSRDPFVVKFSAPTCAAKELVLIPLHAAPHQAVSEIDALYDVYLDVINKWDTDDMLFLGDFNADCNYVRAEDWAAIRLRSSEVFKWLIPDSADTTVGNSDCAYDRIVVCGAHLRRSLKPHSAAVHDFQEEFGLDQDQALCVSDHFPVEVTFKSH